MGQLWIFSMGLLLLLSLSVVYFLKQLWLLRKCPPGPLPLPLIGISWQTGFRLTPDLLIQLYEVFPWLMRHIPGPHQKTLSHIKFIYDLAKEEIEKHKENQSSHEPRDFIDYYLLQLKRSKNDPSNTYDEDNLAECIVDFFIAGTETSATSLQWALLFITNHPDVQDEVYKEIQNTCSSGLICYRDRKKLPYTNAVIHEIQRIYYVLSFGIARRCRKDMNMLGFYIPKLAKRYGNIYTIWSGHMAIVVFSGFQAVKEALIQTEDFAERQMTPFFKEAFKNKGIIFSNGQNWKQQRRFGLITMRKLGLGKKGMENRIEEEAHRLVKIFARAKEQPLDPSLPVTTAISNLICILVFGYRFSAKDEKFQKMLINLNYYMKFGGSFVYLLYELFPWLMKRLPGRHQRVLRALNDVTSFAKEEVEKHRELQSLHDPQDFIDYYLLQMEKTKGDPESAYDEENLAQCIVDFFIAGTETTATTLQWALLLMVAYPEIQEKVRKEIEDTLDPTDSICYQDRVKLPYTYAVIHEVLRLKYVLIVGVPRQSARDVNLNGYHIPKGTLVVTDLNSVLYDPKRWETPEKFNPHHFLDKDGHFIPREEFLAFGAGPRVCLGEQMARMELFLFLTILLRSFKFQHPEGVKELSLEPIMGLSLHPHPYKLCAVPHCRTP
ncbi:cytochrome P450 2J4-like [Erythrolamprus reginae]|uniref:cytochrome P450 2J4-like n=1 Tax=Erythrolamprus reginae TaxID=121349 RepID=UPI00396C451A